MQYPLSEDLT